MCGGTVSQWEVDAGQRWECRACGRREIFSTVLIVKPVMVRHMAPLLDPHSRKAYLHQPELRLVVEQRRVEVVNLPDEGKP